MTEDQQSLPDIDRISVVISTILLSYAVVPFIDIPQHFIDFRLGGIIFSFPIRLTEIIGVLAAALAALGTDWLIQSHPRSGHQGTWQHVIIPALTAWVIGVPLNSIRIGQEWWAIFTFGGLLLILVVVAEYLVVDLSNVSHMPAVIGLTAVSFALYLVVAIVIRTAQTRLYLQLPALVVTLLLVCLRALYLHLGGRWCLGWSIGISLFVGQLAIGLHYLPLSPLAFGLILIGPAYALTSFVVSVEESRPLGISLIEPLIMLVSLWMLALIFG